MKKLFANKKNIIIALGTVALVLVLILGVYFLTGNKNVEGSLPEIMEKLYKGIPKEQTAMFMNFPSTVTTAENFEYYAFAKDVDYTEYLVNEGAMATPHSVVLIRLKNASDADKVVEEIKKNANPRKWICVEAENVIVKSKGNLVILIMSNDLAKKIEKNFDKLR